MKVRNVVATVSASALLVAGSPAYANAQIVAPEPSSDVEIPAFVTDFAAGISPVSREETEQALKIAAGSVVYGGKGISAALAIYNIVTSSAPVAGVSSLIRLAA
ncbi:hypothetical protein M3D57_10370 [Corynebacterium sanguinis]|uniref:hypothetical protein n=1 Tax=Corynebacterium sanguinis TaxID=2594913 RepID=UPI00223AE2D6|nr:hypothetical protein [Corynebacterium sanguinis]MCT1415047.1 hypothetical protein [Corynebacterium sanguinis]MCT1585610.1 hypothetical protein [Corynebacterium sanguinis]MCT2024191.1 hypothetical protein [Corynebacterium sanguinis]MCT2047892.1 hypothetical protein [Corynebacterium sanguinis]MCT2155190.1 hypothetical protein [Corynebacterium sanguinis]